jgi:intracellular multiplication protein IcmE
MTSWLENLREAWSRMEASWRRPAVLSGAGRAGPRRFAVFGVLAAAVVIVVTVVVVRGHQAKLASQDARTQSVDALPGGLHTTPEQNALARQAETSSAQQAITGGASYTPPLAPSVSVNQGAPETDGSTGLPGAQPPLQPVFPQQTVSSPTPVAAPVTVAPAEATSANTPNMTGGSQNDPYAKAVDLALSEISGVRPPLTAVVIPPEQTGESANGTAEPAAHSAGANAPTGSAVQNQVLVPAGRGIYAHPVLALNSDENSPVVLQADSGPLAGDRMIGTFTREDDRLVIHVSEIVHDGQEISCDGVVVAPETMEAGVATGVDEHYLSRIILPAAAAFVQGLGQALATTSNTATVLSPFGGASTLSQLNFRQQLGVAAGTAGGEVGNMLTQIAPKGPTVTLDANVPVGVMFLSDVKAPKAS